MNDPTYVINGNEKAFFNYMYFQHCTTTAKTDCKSKKYISLGIITINFRIYL